MVVAGLEYEGVVLDLELELFGVEVLEFELVVDDGRVTTRVTVVVLEGLLLCVAGVAVEVRAGAVAVVVVVVGLLLVAGLASIEGAVAVVTRLGSCLLLLLLTGSAVFGRSFLLVTTEGSVFPVAGRVVEVVLLLVFPVELPDTE